MIAERTYSTKKHKFDEEIVAKIKSGKQRLINEAIEKLWELNSYKLTCTFHQKWATNLDEGYEVITDAIMNSVRYIASDNYQYTGSSLEGMVFQNLNWKCGELWQKKLYRNKQAVQFTTEEENEFEDEIFEDEEENVYKKVLNEALKVLDENERKIYDLLLAGEKQKDVAKQFGYVENVISDKFKKIQYKLKEYIVHNTNHSVNYTERDSKFERKPKRTKQPKRTKRKLKQAVRLLPVLRKKIIQAKMKNPELKYRAIYRELGLKSNIGDKMLKRGRTRLDELMAGAELTNVELLKLVPKRILKEEVQNLAGDKQRKLSELHLIKSKAPIEISNLLGIPLTEINPALSYSRKNLINRIKERKDWKFPNQWIN